MRVRDLLLTVAAWGVLAWLLQDGLRLVADWLADPIFELTRVAEPDWERLWGRLRPYVGVAALLALWIAAMALWRRAELARKHDPEQPPPLDPETHAATYGLDAAEVMRWRDLQIATIHFDAAGMPARAEGGPSATPPSPG